jgi:hypothetical protein
MDIRKRIKAESDRLEVYFNDLLIGKLTEQEKMDFYPLSLWFTKGLNLSKEGRLMLAGHYFSSGERYQQAIAREGMLWLLLQTTYLPKKAYYLYKTGNRAAAEEMVNDSMDVMKRLERDGFGFLVYGRVQQYHNLARMYLAYGQTQQGLRLIAYTLQFLLTGRSSLLTDLNVPLDQYPDEYSTYNYLFIYQLFFETIEGLLRYPGTLAEKARDLLRVILPAAGVYAPAHEEGLIFQRCILVFQAFFEGDYERYCRETERLVAGWPAGLETIGNILIRYSSWCKDTLVTQ